MSMALVSIAVALAPALLIGALSDDGKIENFLKRSLKNYPKEKTFIIFSGISSLPLSLLVIYLGITGRPNIGTLVGVIGLCSNAILIGIVQFIIYAKQSKRNTKEVESLN
jgi:hypothetical protein